MKQIILGYWSWIKYHLYKPYRQQIEKIAKERMKICENCEYFFKYSKNCMICGCIMSVKTKMEFRLDKNGKSVDGCALHKW